MDDVQPAPASDEWVTLGRIIGLYGVRGWVRVYSHTQPLENVAQYSPWHLIGAGPERPVAVLEGRRQGKGVVVRLDGIDDRDQARALLGAEIRIPRAQLPPLPPGEYYWTDLVGLQVDTVDGQSLGAVDHVMETGANDVLVVRGDRERLIPFLQGTVVRRVDLAARRLEVDWDPDF